MYVTRVRLLTRPGTLKAVGTRVKGSTTSEGLSKAEPYTVKIEKALEKAVQLLWQRNLCINGTEYSPPQSILYELSDETA